MKNIRTIIYSSLIVSLIFLSFPALRAQAALTDWQRGGSIQPFSTTDLGSADAKRAMDTLKSDGANYVTLIIPYYQNNRQSTAMYPSWNTPTDDTLITAINYAHSIGLHVMLKPHLETDYIEWRGNIDVPDADRSKWYESYAEMLEHYGQLAQAHGVEDYCIGTELLRMASPDYHADNTQQWEAMIARVRKVYSGKVTYSANWYGELDRIGFWNSLDYIGVSAYYDLYHAQNSSVPELEKSWDAWRTGVLQPIEDQYKKPIVFTELGYRSIQGAYRDPWDWSKDAPYLEQDQANAYEALFDYWNKYPWMGGVELWRWAINPPAQNSGDKDYVPQNKQAESIMKKYWAGIGSTTPPPPPPNPGGTGTTTTGTGTGTGTTTPPPDTTPVQGTSWTTSASIIPSAPGANSNVSITSVIRNNSSVVVPNAIIDFEVYDPNGTKVLQKYFDSQNFSGNQQRSYNLNWTSGPNGNYILKIGIFNGNWTYNYYWGDKVQMIPVGGTADTTGGSTGTTGGTTGGSSGTTGTTNPPLTSDLNIWWPSDSSTVQGVQPFKAMLTNNDVSNYHMFWQVDGDRLNEMANSTQDYPHKESLVDLTGWSWKGTGPYNINFVAKDNGGTVLKQKSVNINIVQ